MRFKTSKRFRGWVFCLVAIALSASTLFVTSAENPPLIVIPPELDVRAAGGVLRGGSVPTTAQSGSDAPASQSVVQALAQWRTVDAAQTKALQSLQSEGQKQSER